MLQSSDFADTLKVSSDDVALRASVPGTGVEAQHGSSSSVPGTAEEASKATSVKGTGVEAEPSPSPSPIASVTPPDEVVKAVLSANIQQNVDDDDDASDPTFAKWREMKRA